jgi:serine/threonine-protein kinase
VIGQYRVTDVLGEGGMGVVYAAEHTLLRRPAAVKLLLPELSTNQEIVQRFFNEARAATAIRHPGIVEVYDFGWTSDGAGFIVMELLQGETLRARRKRGRIPWPAALAVTRQIAGALGAAHAKGIVHRDLKPDNIFLVPDAEVPGGERIKLLDFGIAKLADSSAHHKTRTGALIGTPTYMAPEQCRGVEVDARADLYALGCILFELCSGRPPFEGEGHGDVLAAHIHVPAPTLSSRMDGVPEGVETLLQRLLAKAPLDRIQTADEVIRVIDALGPALNGPRAFSSFHALHEPVLATNAYVEPVRKNDNIDTTLSSAVISRRSSSLRAPGWRLVLGGIAGGVAVLVVALTLTAGGDSNELTPSNLHNPSAAASIDAEQRPPSTPPLGASQEPRAAPMPDPAVPSGSSAPVALPVPATSTAAEARAATTVEVVITSSPSGAEILSGGNVIGVTPFRRELPRTDLAIMFVVRLRGHAKKVLTISTGASSKQHVLLAPASPSAAPSKQSSSSHRGINPFEED